MALELCNDCPLTCAGNEYSTDCGYMGVSIPSKGISKGDSLTGALQKIAEDSSSTVTVSADELTTDDIITNSLVRNPSALCASKIITRDFEYSLSATTANSIFSWDVLNIVSNLPAGYKVGTIRVKATGKAIGNDTTIFDSTKLSAAQKIDFTRYPVTVDFSLRIVTDCGNVDMTKQIYLSSPITQDMTRVFMRVNDLLPGNNDDLKLTQQLDILEAGVQFNSQKLNELEIVEIDGVKQDFRLAIITHDQAIDDIQETLANPTGFSITYEDNGVSNSRVLGNILTELYSLINSQSNTIAQMQVDIDTLKAQVETLI